MLGWKSSAEAEVIKKAYPIGSKIELEHMNEDGMPSGLKGTVRFVDDQGQLHMVWENGRSLALVPGEDEFHMIQERQVEKVDLYVDYINEKILPVIDYIRLQADYETTEKAYAKSVLNELHKGMIQIYGTNDFAASVVGDYVVIPGVIQSRSNGNICVGVLELDLMASGEHYGTSYLTKYGCISQFGQGASDEIRRFLKETYGPYEYAYTPEIENDIHIDKNLLPEGIREFLKDYQKYDFVPSSAEEFQRESAKDEDVEEFER